MDKILKILERLQQKMCTCGHGALSHMFCSGVCTADKTGKVDINGREIPKWNCPCTFVQCSTCKEMLDGADCCKCDLVNQKELTVEGESEVNEMTEQSSSIDIDYQIKLGKQFRNLLNRYHEKRMSEC